MKFVLFLGAVLTVSQLVLGHGNNFRTMKEERTTEATDYPAWPVQPEEVDTPGAFQSDMILTPEQWDEIRELIREEETGVYKRRAMSTLSKRWPQNKLVYELDASSEPNRDKIIAGIDHWTQHTCVQFLPYTAEVAAEVGHSNRVKIINGIGCWSYYGMAGVVGGVQELSIGKGCTDLDTVAHEFGHALGWYHEQSRPDRDEHVTIKTENIEAGKESNFVKYTTSQVLTYDVPYDAGSNMHYGAKYFSSNGLPTIVAINPINDFLMGYRGGFSFYDKKLANLMFDCDKTCTNNLQCQNEGYVDETCTCVCKQGYSGSLCETYKPEEAGCIRELTGASGASGVLTSPGYPVAYKNAEVCVWKITGAAGTKISLTFQAFHLRYDAICQYDKVTVRSVDITTGGAVYCGTTVPPVTTSTGNQMLVAFTTSLVNIAPGFNATYVIN